MLPTELLINRQNGEEIIPKRLPIDARMCAIAIDLISCFQEAVGGTQGELDRKLLELEGDSPDYRLKRGLAHILKSSFCTFEIVSPLDPPLLRQRVFALSAKSIPSPQASEVTLEQLSITLSQELNHEVLPQQIRTGLYADLQENSHPDSV
jgi:predicted nuclease of restriction endonuclease-like RecB superfamily